MGEIDLDHLRSWIGKSHSDEDLLSLRQARLMAATVDYFAPERIALGEILPPLWHWIYFLEGLPASALGRDGHPARGGFLPPVPLPNRMWAGGRVAFLAPLRIGAIVRKESRILKVDHKTGRSGDLVFVTVLHELKSPHGELLVSEEHDIVYKGPPPPAEPAKPVSRPPAAPFTKTFTPDSTTLFRYSALTFNGHRIHYDADYCRNVEAYPNLVIHGPLTATLLASYAEEVSNGRLADFSYRGVSPAILGDSITLAASVHGKRVAVHALLGNGMPSMNAEAVVG
jgi:3-methylfumaryl-CoA hydratase